MQNTEADPLQTKSVAADSENLGNSAKRLHVAVAVIDDGQGRVLLTKRSAGVHQGGLWEFPGGKLEADEDVLAALTRELVEELDIRLQQVTPLINIHHDYPQQSVLLDVWRVTHFSGVARGCEGQPLQWVTADQLSEFDFPAANHAIVTALQLPAVYLITQSSIADEAHYYQKLESLLQTGIKLVQFRMKDLDVSEFKKWVSETRRYCRLYGAKLIVNADASVVEELDVDGVHLSSERLMACKKRPLAQNKWVAASCHNARELNHAADIGVDFVVLSPVLATKSHPGVASLGWQRFSELVTGLPIPVYALGGMDLQQIESANQHGAQGVAVLGSMW